MSDYPLFSISVVSYKNFRYIFETIDSIFNQDYPNIELVISNDGSSDFDYDMLLSYIIAHKRENISSFFINNNETNVGTVRHLNIVRGMVKGNYMMFIAADDALNDEKVITRFVQFFEEHKGNCLLVTSQCGMYDIHLNEILQLAVSEENIKKLTTVSPMELYKSSIFSIIIPSGGTAYNKRIFEKIGSFDEDYFLIEDASFFLKALRLGIKIHYIDFVSIKHRDGGISHGNLNNDNVAFSYYYLDEIKVFEKEVIPYKNVIGEELWVKANLKVRELKFGYFKRFKWKHATALEKVKFISENRDVVFRKLREKHLIDARRKIVSIVSQKKYHLTLIMIALFTFLASEYVDYSSLIGDVQNYNLMQFYNSVSKLAIQIEILLFLLFGVHTLYKSIKENRYMKAYSLISSVILVTTILYWLSGLSAIWDNFNPSLSMRIFDAATRGFIGMTSLYLVLFLCIFVIGTQMIKIILRVKAMFFNIIG